MFKNYWKWLVSTHAGRCKRIAFQKVAECLNYRGVALVRKNVMHTKNFD